MKSKKVKMLCTALSTIILFSALVGCSTKKKETTAEEEQNNGPRTELKLEIFDRGNLKPGQQPVDNNDYTKYIQKNFGDKNNIDVKFIPVPRGKEVDQLNILMAAGDAPDLVYTYDSNVVYNYVKQGGLTDLSSLLTKNGPNLVKYLGEDVLDWGVFDGKQFAVPAKRALVGNQSSVIRKDWLDKVGLAVPKTTQEFYAALKAFKEKDPGKLGDKIVPFKFDQYGYQQLVDSFVTKMTEEETYMYDSGFDRPNPLRPGVIEGYRFLNKSYNEGLINLSYVLDKDGKVGKQEFVNGYIGSYTANNGVRMDMLKDLKATVPEAQYVAMDAYTNYEGKTVKPLNTPVGAYMMVPKSSKASAQAIKYLDWMTKPEVLMYLQNGVEGVDYNLKDGLPVPIVNDDLTKLTYGGGVRGDWGFISNGKDLGSLDKNIKAQSLSYPGNEQLYIDEYKVSTTNAVSPVRFDKPIVADGTYGAALTQKWNEMVIKMVSCKPAEFEKTFNEAKQIYLTNGGQQIMDERKAAYQAMKKK